jgi:hypothetical protein
MLLALFRILLTRAVRKRYIKTNPALRPGRIAPPKRSEIGFRRMSSAFSISPVRRCGSAFYYFSPLCNDRIIAST